MASLMINKRKIVKLAISLSIVSIILTSCADNQSPVGNLTILDAKVIRVKQETHYSPRIIVEVSGKTFELADYDEVFYWETKTLLKTASTIQSNDLITFDFIVTNDLSIKAFSLSKNRQH